MISEGEGKFFMCHTFAVTWTSHLVAKKARVMDLKISGTFDRPFLMKGKEFSCERKEGRASCRPTPHIITDSCFPMKMNMFIKIMYVINTLRWMGGEVFMWKQGADGVNRETFYANTSYVSLDLCLLTQCHYIYMAYIRM